MERYVLMDAFMILERMNEILIAGAREDESGRYSLSCGIK